MTRLTDLYHRQFLGKSPKDFVEKPWLPKDKQGDRVHSSFTVIKLNSTYVETVDESYANRGFGAMTGLLLGGILLFFTALACVLEISRGNFPWFYLCMGSPVIFIGYWTSRLECFAFTHYPIRYNRKNRCVYIWRPKGQAVKAKWDELCFFPMPRSHPLAERLIVAAILSADKSKIEDMFFLGTQGGDSDQQKMYVEFLRRYMDQGPEAVVHDKSFWCLPRLDFHREGWWFGWKKLMLLDNGWPIAQLIWMPFVTVQSFFRFLAMRTSKIPVWPEWVEAECQVDSDDPWVRDADTNPTKSE
jgi:hypothetical protein